MRRLMQSLMLATLGKTFSFLGWVFRYGTVSVKRTEGITITTATDFVHNAWTSNPTATHRSARLDSSPS